MNSKEFINKFLKEDNDIPYRSSRIKFQAIPSSHKISKLQELCKSLNIVKGDNIFVKDNNDYQHSVFIRAGEKMIHVHNYVTNKTEAIDPEEAYTKEGFKYVPIIRGTKRLK